MTPNRQWCHQSRHRSRVSPAPQGRGRARRGCATLLARQGRGGTWLPRGPRPAGDWLSGRAPRSHRGGHWFDPSIAHPVHSPVPIKEPGFCDLATAARYPDLPGRPEPLTEPARKSRISQLSGAWARVTRSERDSVRSTPGPDEGYADHTEEDSCREQRGAPVDQQGDCELRRHVDQRARHRGRATRLACGIRKLGFTEVGTSTNTPSSAAATSAHCG